MIEESVSALQDPGNGTILSARTRSRWIALWVVSCIVIGASALVVGSRIETPWDAAIANAATKPAVTAAIEQRTFLPEHSFAEGTVSLGSLTEVSPVVAEGATAVVTRVHVSPGTDVGSGEPVIEVSGRPVIALTLPFALYRDLLPGDSGPDVLAIQDCLIALGLLAGPADGLYGPATAAAVRALFTKAGVAPPEPAPEFVERLETAQQALSEARTEADIRRAEAAAARATEAVADGEPKAANDDAGGAPATSSEARTAAEAALAAAEAAADAAAATAEAAMLSRLQVDAAAARVAADTPLPRAEITRLPGPSAEVVQIQPVGTELAGIVPAVAFTFRFGTPTASARTGVADVSVFAVGQTVRVVAAADSAKSADATVAGVSEFRAADTGAGVELPGYDLALQFASVDALPFTDGDRIIVTSNATEEALTGLAVPLSAVREDGDGLYVLLHAPGAQSRVEVEVVTTADGYALITGPPGLLEEGDVIVVVG